jgi:dTDP-4-dehydrorhamnose reductase
MKLLIAGAYGQLGRALVEQSNVLGFEALAPSRRQLDITDFENVKQFFALHRPFVVINAAAYTQVDNAETEKSSAFAVNKTGCANIAQTCAENGMPLIQISTDYVFDGKKSTPYLETDPIAPSGVYGRSKAEGEKEVRSHLEQHIILRTSWLYGVHGHNFVKSILKLAGEEKIIRVVSDQYGSPTSAFDLAQVIFIIVGFLIKNTTVDWGTYHYCGHGVISWHEFAEAIVNFARTYFDVKTTLVEPIKTADYPSKAARPFFSALDCSLIEKHFGIVPKPWHKSLKSTIQSLLSSREGCF